MARKRISHVWEFFEEPEVILEEENISEEYPASCEQQLTDDGETTNLLSHLQAKHPQEYK